jgi:hypothetical protein
MTSATTDASSAVALRRNDTFRFLDLPVELRCQVYEHFVVVGKVFYTPDDYAVMTEKRFNDWESYKAPHLQILRVCKEIHNEAEDVYLSKNLFVLPDFFAYHAPFKTANLEPQGHIQFSYRSLFSAAANKYLKNISISVNPRLSAPITLNIERCRNNYPDFDN